MNRIRRAVTTLAIFDHQFGFLRGVLRLLQQALIRLIDPSLIPSYGQYGEDRIWEAYFHGKRFGRYVDVGCNEPVKFSNTWKLYLRGWTGLAIDANGEVVSKYRRTRPRDIAIQALVGSESGSVSFELCRESRLSRVVSDPDGLDAANVVALQTTRLDQLLKSHEFEYKFDLLTIDVEGFELSVLNSIDLHSYKPQLIIVEIHSFDVKNVQEEELTEFLVPYGYVYIGYFGVNVLFVRNVSG